MPPFSLGLSPCPNDTYIFHALLHGLVKPDYPGEINIVPHMADVEELNRMALEKKLMATKISVGALPMLLDDYCLLASGAALGWGCGPLVVARPGLNPERFQEASIAIPGELTTANLLLGLHGKFQGPRKAMLFSDVMDAVANGETDLGVIIHEGRFTWQRRGLTKVLDLGQWWEESFQMPLPLGAIVIRRDIAAPLARAIERAIAASLAYARRNPGASADFIRQNAQELDEAVTKAHIDTFVTAYSADLGAEGARAMRLMLEGAGRLGAPKNARPLFLQ